jgi:hypothetical protein
MSENDYCFFFSYSCADHNNAKRSNVANGANHNLLDCFFDQLTRIVSSRIGMDLERVAFRDSKRLELGESWPESLTTSLQCSRTLIALITPQFLKSENCGREIKFFMDRYDRLLAGRPDNRPPHRILPIYWESSADCDRVMPDSVKQFFADIQFKTEDFPETYPATGLRSIVSNGDSRSLENVCDALAGRIVQFHTENALPPHPDLKPFTELPSLFTPLPDLHCACEPVVASGTGAAQVVFVVGKGDEFASAGHDDITAYGNTPEEWQPFMDAPGATVEAATEEGIRRVGGMACCNWGWPANLVGKITEAQEKKSPVLLVLDRNSLQLERFRTSMQEYDRNNFNNAGLITAGGNTSDDDVAQVFEHKFNNFQNTHLWTVPTGRIGFVENVASVIGHIKRKLLSIQTTGFHPTPLPSLRGPCGN